MHAESSLGNHAARSPVGHAIESGSRRLAPPLAAEAHLLCHVTVTWSLPFSRRRSWGIGQNIERVIYPAKRCSPRTSRSASGVPGHALERGIKARPVMLATRVAPPNPLVDAESRERRLPSSCQRTGGLENQPPVLGTLSQPASVSRPLPIGSHLPARATSGKSVGFQDRSESAQPPSGSGRPAEADELRRGKSRGVR